MLFIVFMITLLLCIFLLICMMEEHPVNYLQRVPIGLAFDNADYLILYDYIQKVKHKIREDNSPIHVQKVLSDNYISIALLLDNIKYCSTMDAFNTDQEIDSEEITYMQFLHRWLIKDIESDIANSLLDSRCKEEFDTELLSKLLILLAVNNDTVSDLPGIITGELIDREEKELIKPLCKYCKNNQTAFYNKYFKQYKF